MNTLTEVALFLSAVAGFALVIVLPLMWFASFARRRRLASRKAYFQAQSRQRNSH